MEILAIESDLKELLDYSSRSLVGKILKRIELTNNPELIKIKPQIKELVYEEYRTLRDILLAQSKGINVTIYEFKSKDVK